MLIVTYMMKIPNMHIIIIGAGPAGLTAAYLLAKENISVTVLEADPTYVGGIARTVQYKGFCFDIGGHRFYSKSKEVEDFWTEILPDDMLERPRLSRIFYRGKFFSYPLKIFEVIRKLGFIESIYCFFSYLKAKLFFTKNPKTFTDWVCNHFGYRLFSIFFKTYTEKVWGMRCEDISADWAAQRIKGLSFISALKSAILPKKWFKKNNQVIKTLIDEFRYPRKGPGMLWEECARKISKLGGAVQLDAQVVGCDYHNKQWMITVKNSLGKFNQITGTHLISSAPLRDFILEYLKPQMPNYLQDVAAQLKYRDFLIVALILKDHHSLSDNWIYIHDSQVDVARIQNFKAWSSEMVPDSTLCCYGMEYFCFSNDSMWIAKDDELIEKAISELVQIGLAKKEDILDGCVVRQAKAYPVYDEKYKKNVSTIVSELNKRFTNLYLVGRNGMHKYNNQDHAMMTAMLTVKNIIAGETVYDTWNVNQDAEYIESGERIVSLDMRSVPERVIQ